VRDTRRTRIAFAALLAVALTLIIIDRTEGLAPLSAAGSAVFGTAERAVSSVTRPIGGFFGRAFGAAGSDARNQALQRELIRLRAQLRSEQLDRAEYAQLARLLRLSGPHGYRIVAANVIAVGQGYQQTVTVDAGGSDGIRPRETVLNGAGLVGTVTSVSRFTSTVLLVTDTTAVAGVRLAGTGQMGWVTGVGRGYAGADLLRLHILGSADRLTPGQQLVTSASLGDGPYVPGVPVGTITRVDARLGAPSGTAIVRPYADVSALDIVGVVITQPRRGHRG
jgi:rod shape-determining protein MreC